MMKRKYLLIIAAAVALFAVVAFSVENKPNRYNYQIDNYPRWPVVSLTTINGGLNSRSQGGGRVGLNFPDNSHDILFELNWAEVHSKRSYSAEFRVDYREFHDFQNSKNTIDIYIRYGMHGEVFIGTNEYDPVEILVICGERTPLQDHDYKEQLEWDIENFGKSYNSALHLPLPPTTCPDPEY